MFEKLSEVGNLTSRDIDLLLLSSRDLTNQTNSVSDHYHARKECFDNLTFGNKDCQDLISLAGNNILGYISVR